MDNKEKKEYLIAAASFNLGSTNPEFKNIIVSDGPCGLRNTNSKKYPNGIPEICLPCVNNIACSFDEEVAYNMGRVIASQCASSNVDIILAPGVNIKRTPLCGRNFEYFSEDPYLAGILGSQYILGVQDFGIGTSLKHFFLNNREYDRLHQSSNASYRTIREIYTKQFEMIINKANPWTIMCSYNPINGTNCAENKFALKEILRDKLYYKNVLISDWGAVHDRNEALNASLDIQFPFDKWHKDKFNEDFNNGKVDLNKVEESFKRIEDLANKIEQNKNKRKVLSNKKVKELCIDGIAKSCVLLKNDDNILPLKDGSVLVVGDGNNRPYYNGGGSAHIESKIPFARLSDKLVDENPNLKVIARDLFYEFDCLNFIGNIRVMDVANTLEMASRVDKLVFIAGNTYVTETEGSDRTSIRLDKRVEDLINKFAKANKNIVVVLESGSVIDTSAFIDNVKGCLNAGFAGSYANDGIAKVLTGNLTPSGRLSETYPYSLNDTYCKDTILDGLNDNYDDGIFVGYRYYQHNDIKVRFPFGYGMSYAKFDYSNIKIKKISKYDYEVSLKVNNRSDFDDYEVIEIFVKNPLDNPVSRPVKEFRRFKKVLVKANSSKNVKFEINKDCFEYFNENIDAFDVNDGEYEIQISKNANDVIKSFKVEIK